MARLLAGFRPVRTKQDARSSDKDGSCPGSGRDIPALLQIIEKVHEFGIFPLILLY
jgi:hypothetical protein